jgi:hypothetical protein
MPLRKECGHLRVPGGQHPVVSTARLHDAHSIWCKLLHAMSLEEKPALDLGPGCNRVADSRPDVKAIRSSRRPACTLMYHNGRDITQDICTIAIYAFSEMFMKLHGAAATLVARSMTLELKGSQRLLKIKQFHGLSFSRAHHIQFCTTLQNCESSHHVWIHILSRDTYFGGF